MHTDSLSIICCWSICHVFVWDRNGHRDSGRILTCVEFLRYVFDLAGHGPAVLACGLTDLDSLLLCQHSLKSSNLAGGEVHSSFECNHKRRCLDMQDCRKDCLENLIQVRILHLQNPTQDCRNTTGNGIQWNRFRIGCRKQLNRHSST